MDMQRISINFHYTDYIPRLKASSQCIHFGKVILRHQTYVRIIRTHTLLLHDDPASLIPNVDLYTEFGVRTVQIPTRE